MEPPISRSQKKRQAKALIELAKELIALPKVNIGQLPCDNFLKEEIIHAQGLKGGARQRQLKFISKNLRKTDPEPLFDFLKQNKGSKLKETKRFHELERVRDEIIDEAFDELRQAEKVGERLNYSNWRSKTIDALMTKYTNLDRHSIQEAATKFAITRKHNYKREIFRILKAAFETIEYK